MADLGSKEALKTSINGKIFTNTTFEVSAEDIRSSFEDTIDTICTNATVLASYAELETLVTNSQLVVGEMYVFPYETVSLVGSAQTSLLNTSVPGYTPIVEQIAVIAKSTNAFFNSARSINYPEDIIMYDFTDNVETTTSTSRSGLIYYRKDTKRSIEAYFDFRNNYVARYELSKTGVEITSTQIVSKGSVIYYNVSGSTISPAWYFVNIATNDIVADAEANPDILTDIDTIEQSMYSESQIEMGISNIQADASTVSYHQSIDGVSEKIIIGADTNNVLITASNSIYIGENSAKITVNNSNFVRIGKSANRIIAKDLTDSDLGDVTADIHLFGGSAYELGFLVRNFISISSSCTKLGANTNEIVSIGGSSNNEVGCDSSSIFFLRDADYNVLGKNNSNITFFKANNNTMESSCSSIQIYGGNNNRFAQSCTLINMLGDRDEAFGFGTSYISPYSKMDNNTFGTSCENITFENVGGRGNTFGDECANLVFTNTSVNTEWRLVGCDFCRGIRNKTFQEVIHGASFIVPNQETQTITTDDWYAPQLYVGAVNIVDATASGTSSAADGDRLTSGGSQNLNTHNRIAVGYERVGWFFNSTGGDSAASRATITPGVNANNTSAEYKIYGPPTNKAFQWTHDGYPLLINFISTNVPSADSTSDLTT